MKVIAGNRRTGRTTKLIDLCWEAHQNGQVVYIVTHTVKSAQNINKLALDKGYTGFPFPLTLREAFEYRGADAAFYIDNAELVIGVMFPYMKIAAITVTTENDET
jgi:hypothetical protein